MNLCTYGIYIYTCSDCRSSLEVFQFQELVHWSHDVRRITEQPHPSSTVQARRLSLFSHIARMPDESDAKQILSARPPQRTGGDYQDVPIVPEIDEPLRERSNRHGSESSTLEIDVYVWRYALIVVHTTNDYYYY